MKKLILLAIIALSSSLVSAQNQSTPYMFTGKLISSPSSVTACGTLSVSYAYEFEITMFSDESYTQQNVAIIINCPDLLGANFFKTDAVYKMEVFTSTSGNVSNQSVLDAYNLSQFYTAGDIRRIQ